MPGAGQEAGHVNLAERLATNAARLPDKPALRYQGSDTTYAALAERVAKAAGALLGLGLQPGDGAEAGDRVALLLPNCPQFVEAFHAAAHAGLVAVPLNVGFTREEVCHILVDSGARAIVVMEPFLPTVEGLLDELDALEVVIVAGASSVPDGGRLWRTLVDAAAPVPLAEVGDDAVALLQYTSGTTGRPKGAMLSHGNLLANQQQMAQTQLKVAEGDVVLCVLPLFHIYALNVAMAFPLARAATVLLVERFDAAQTLQDIARERVSVVVGAPPMYVAWVNTPGVAAVDLGSVRFAISGAAALPVQVLERFRSDLGVDLWEGYGLTETAPLLTTVAMGDELRPGSVGKPVPGVEIRLVDERGQPVRRGDPGEVVVRGPNVFSGYWRQPDATREVLDADGWFRTGDIGYAAEGNLHLVDRKKDLVIVSGFNVYPREVEEVLYRHPKVADAAVIGVPHPYTGEAVKAVVVLRDGEEATAQELIDHSARSLARFKCPEVVEFVEALPLLPSGKVLRRRLRDGGAAG
jgi:long-chain acyl-CoA synthetase